MKIHNLDLQVDIDFKRHKTHKLYDVQKLMGKISIHRNCRFKYYVKNKEKVYSKKWIDVFVEEFIGVNAKDGKRIGSVKINLSEYIDLGIRTTTFKLDKAGTLFLTADISVMMNHGFSLLTKTMASVNTEMLLTTGTSFMSESDEEDEQEKHGNVIVKSF